MWKKLLELYKKSIFRIFQIYQLPIYELSIIHMYVHIYALLYYIHISFYLDMFGGIKLKCIILFPHTTCIHRNFLTTFNTDNHKVPQGGGIVRFV